jgi:protein-disulfide isomerase
MNRTIYALMVLMIALTAAVKSQTQTASPKNTLSPVKETGGQSNSMIEDCACESQILPETAAIVSTVKITSNDIKKATRQAVSELQRQVIEARKNELDLTINSRLLAMEAKKRGLPITKLLEQEVVAKVKPPTPAEAQAFYDQNKARIKEEFKDVAEEITAYLLDQRQRLEAKRFADELRQASETKVLIAEVTPPTNQAERARILATIKGEPITSGELEDSLKALIFDVQEKVYKLRKDELDLTINDILLAQEAQRRKITTNALLDAEVKPQPVTDEQARAFYEENKERVSGDFAQTKDAIRRYLEQVAVRQAERAFVEKLRAAASIQVFLVAPESPIFSISTADQPSLGNANAPVIVIAFTDYQCPSCAAMHPSLERLVKEYGDKVRLVTRDFPLTQHSEAFKAAEAAEAAREQGKYWEYIHVLMRNQSALGVEQLKSYATELGLDRARFDSALDTGKFKETIQTDVDEGLKLGLNATPTIFINGRRVAVKGYEELKASVEAALKSLSLTTRAGVTSTIR